MKSATDLHEHGAARSRAAPPSRKQRPDAASRATGRSRGRPRLERADRAGPPRVTNAGWTIPARSIFRIPNRPKRKTQLVAKFLAGLDKLFSRENNWTFLQPLVLTMEHCAKCQTCADACHIFEASGRERTVPAHVPCGNPAPPVFQIRARRRTAFRLAAWRGRSELADGGPPRRIVVPLQSVPPLRPDVPHRRGQRPGGSRTAQALQHGDGDRPQGDSRQRLHAPVEGGLFHRHECRRP